MGTGVGDAFTAGAGFATTTAGWASAGAGWMGWTWGRGRLSTPRAGPPSRRHGRAAPCPPESGHHVPLADGKGKAGWDGEGTLETSQFHAGNGDVAFCTGFGGSHHGGLGVTSTSAHAEVGLGASQLGNVVGTESGMAHGAGGDTPRRRSRGPKATWMGPRGTQVPQKQHGWVPKMPRCPP